jgi:hypothetical protein
MIDTVIPAPTPPVQLVVPTPSIPSVEKTPRLVWVLLLLVISAQLAFVLHYAYPAITSPDANGYYAQGALLYQTGRTWFQQESDVQYVGMHWLVTDDGRYFSRYPPGLSVLIAGLYGTFGPNSCAWIDPAFATLSLLGLFFLLRRFLGPWYSLAGVFLLAINPVFNLHAQYNYAHMPVACLLIWGLLFLLRWAANGRLVDIFVAGLLLGCIPTIRYPEATFALGIAVFGAWELRTKQRRWLHVVAALAGAALPIVPMLIRNQTAFGAFYRTAYVLTHEQSGFGWNYFVQHFTGYIRSLHADGMGMLFPFGVVGLAVMCLDRQYRRAGVLIALIVVPSTLLYMAYYWGMGLNNGNGGNMRYLMPTFACYVVTALWFLKTVLASQPVALQRTAMVSLLAFQIFWGAWSSIPEYERMAHQKQVLAITTDHLEKTVSHEDVVIADQQLQQHLDFIHHWKLADSSLLQARNRGGRFMNLDRDPNEPSPQQSKKYQLFEEKYGELSASEREVALVKALQTWAGKQKVYFVGPEGELDALGAHGFSKSEFKIVERISLPVMPEEPGNGMFGGMRRNRGGGGGGGGPGGWGRNGGRGGPPGGGGAPPGGPPPGGFGGPPPGGPGPGGPGGWGMRRFDDKEYVIAVWNPSAGKTAPAASSDSTSDFPEN